MTEAEWLECDDPDKLLRRARFRSYRRKSRLFAVACCRLIWDSLVDERSRKAVDLAERYADGGVTEEELRIASVAANEAHEEIFNTLGKTGACIEWAAAFAADPNPLHGAKNASWAAATPRTCEVRKSRKSDCDEIRQFPCSISKRSGPLTLILGKWKVVRLNAITAIPAEKPVQAALIRCIFGNPFRPVTFDPACLTPNAKTLARAIYDDRAFEGMPVLADVLEEAGCGNQDIVDHCRGPGPHVRGCWVVDLVLGKE